VNIHTPAFNRRRFLQTFGQGALLATLPGSLWADDPDAVTISILHTTDLHGHIMPTVDYSDHPDLGGLARCATQIRQWQRDNPNSILLDIGDVYQGTEVSLRTGGATMIHCLNALNYDAWVVGNHEFDWGAQALIDSVGLSSMPVLSGNAMFEGKPAGALGDSAGPLAKLQPYLIKEVAGIRVATIGLTTPALTTWLPPEDLRGFEMLDPVETLRGLLREVSAQKPDAILLAGHMGLTRRDDYANRVGILTREFPQLVAFLGGHTHQNHSSEVVNNILYTQADHFGIYVGKVDLTFDRNSRRLLQRTAVTVQMDKQIAFDPLVLALTQAEVDAADQILAHPMGELTERFDAVPNAGAASDVERLIGSAMVGALRAKGVEVDFIVHGLFDKHPLLPGSKTVADAWTLLPYENQIVTMEVSHDDLLAIDRELTSGRDFPHLMTVGGSGANSTPPAKATYRVALNSYDSQSGGQRFPTMAKLVADPANHRTLHAIQIRNALIDYFATCQKVSKASLLV
jgi:2',3'-cyclic-nucleotide 2'-phosphodiesterase (5'-nucleotidase family)